MATSKSARAGRGSSTLGASDAPRDVKVTVAFPVQTYHKTLYFNRFRLEPLDLYVLMTFALARPTGEILSCARALISKPEIEDTKPSLGAFLANQLEGYDLPPHHHFDPPSVNPNMADLPIVNQINVAIQIERNITEMVLSRYSTLTVANVTRMETTQKPPIPVEGVALLRCEPSLFKLFLVKLYEAAERPEP